MSEPCTQGKAFERMDDKLDKVLDALQVVAAQKVQIENLAEEGKDHHSWLKGHELRIQSLEKQPGKIAGKALAVIVGIGSTIASGLIVYAATH